MLKLHIVRSSGKEHHFSISTCYESLQITNPRKGYIETYHWKGGNMGYEEESLYKYHAHYEDWLLIKVTTNAPGYRTTIDRPDVPTGISGREYPRQKRKPRRK